MEDHNEKGHVTWQDVLRICVGMLVIITMVYVWGPFTSLVSAVFVACLPVLIGLLVAYVVNLPMRFFENVLPGEGNVKHTAALALACICTFGLVLFIVAGVVPQVWVCAMNLAVTGPETVKEILQIPFMDKLIPADMQAKMLAFDWADWIDRVTGLLGSGTTDAPAMALAVIGPTGTMVMGVMLGVMILGEKEKVEKFAHRMVRTFSGERGDARFTKVGMLLDDCFSRYIVLRAITAVITGVLAIILCSVLGLPAGVPVGALVGVLSLVPMVGPPVAAGIGAFLALSISWQKALIFLVCVLLIQMLVESFVFPAIFDKVVGMSPLLMVIGVVVGGGLGGILGTFVGVPLMMALERLVSDRLEEHETRDKESLVERLHNRLS